jgi:hypothetical protein
MRQNFIAKYLKKLYYYGILAMLKNGKIKLLPIVTLVFIATTSCNLMFFLDDNKKEDDGTKFPPLISRPLIFYNEDGTEFKGNGKVHYYLDNDKDARNVFYYDIINGKQENRIVNNKASTDFFSSWIDNPPSFSVIPSDYTSSDISIKIINVNNKVNCSAKQGSFWVYRFYDKDKPYAYKLLENMGEIIDEYDNITRLFYTYFCFVYPEEGYRSIKGEIEYTQILTDLHSGNTEKADVKVIYDLDFGYFGPDRKTTSPFYFTYTKAIYTILEKSQNNIHYKVNITIGFIENMTKEDKIYTSDTIVDKYFRMK